MGFLLAVILNGRDYGLDGLSIHTRTPDLLCLLASKRVMHSKTDVTLKR